MKVKLSANKKKVIVLSCMVVLLVVAGVLNFVLNTNLPNAGGNPDGDVTTTFFGALRTSRESKRAEQMAIYQSIADSETSTAEAKANAETAMAKLTAQIEMELNLETVIKTGGYADVVVSLSDKNVHVTLNKETLEITDLENVYLAVEDNTDYVSSQVTVVTYPEAQ